MTKCPNPEEDGITHINIYSKGSTELGRLLSNFAHRKAVLSEAEKWIGKYLTVEFESYSKGGKPTKPVGIYKREGEWNEETQEFVPSE